MGFGFYEEDLQGWRSDGNFSPDFKEKVALEALRGEQTLAELVIGPYISVYRNRGEILAVFHGKQAWPESF